MLVHISAKTFDLSGALSITPLPRSRTPPSGRRVTRVATLDGGVAINDRGFAHGDRTLTLLYKPVSAAHDAIAQRIVELHTRVTLTTSEGCFEAAPDTFTPTPEENSFSFLIISKLSE